MVALLVAALGLVLAPGCRQTHAPTCARRHSLVRLNDEPVPEDVLAKCMAMRVTEIKAELELRKVSADNAFEKEELATRLARARASGEADPDLLSMFNRQSAEAAFNDGASGDELPLESAVAADGALPGGLSPDALARLTSDPELMALLRNPKMQDVMSAVMQGGPEAFQKHADDPEVMEMLRKLRGLTG